MNSTLQTQALGIAGAVLVALALATIFFVVALSPTSPARSLWQRYVAYLNDELAFLMEKIDGARVAQGQLILILMSIAVAVALHTVIPLLVTPIIALFPYVWFRRLRANRVLRLEEQLDSWLLALANSLKASASLGDAIASTQRMLHPPMAQEVDLLLKENVLGVPLDVAIQSMGARIGSRAISSALITLLVARRSGGNLPETLEKTAASLREMARLEGVLRTRTAAGKSQAYVLGAVPPILTLVVHKVSPDLLVPLFTLPVGNFVLAIAIALWISSVLVAKKILAVDL